MVESKRSGRERLGGVRDRVVIVAEQASREQGIGEKVMVKRVNLVTVDCEVIEKKNRVRNE